MSVLAGLTGQVVLGSSVVASTSQWGTNIRANNVAAVLSNTAGMTMRNKGPRDFTGSFMGKHKAALGFIVPGTVYTFYGQMETDEMKAAIICSQVVYNAPISSGGHINYTANFEAAGSSDATLADNTLYVLQNKTSFSDSTDPAAYASVEGGAKVHWNPLTGGTLAGDAEVNEIQDWSLTLSCATKPWVSSSTGGVTKRRAGPKDASATVRMLQSDLSVLQATASILTPGQYGVLKLYVDSTTYFLLEYCNVNSLNMVNNHETGDLDAVDVGFDYTGYAIVSGAYDKGQIVDPSSNVFWN